MEFIFTYLQSGVSAILPFIILLGLLIFVHELGHFLVAIWCGVRVEVFSLGFGKKIFSHKRGDTTYCISLIPLGGYVKMYGDEIGADLPDDQKEFSFTHKPVWKRIAIVLAGPLMNFFFAIFLFALVAGLGEEVRSPIVGDVEAESFAYQAGFRSGDQIISVNNQIKVQSWDEFQSILNVNLGQPIDILVKHNNEEMQIIRVSPSSKENPNILSLDETIGNIDGLSPSSQSALIAIKHDSLAHKAGLKTGDRITAIGSKEVHFFRDLDAFFTSKQEQTIVIKVDRASETEKVEKLELSLKLPTKSTLSSVGIESPELYLAKIIDGSPAKIAGLQNGDKIISISEKSPQAWGDVLTFVKNYDQKNPLKFEVLREGKSLNFSIIPQMTSNMTQQGGEEKRFTIGIVPWMTGAMPHLIKVRSSNPFSAVVRGFDKTIEITKMTVVSFLRLIQNKISHKNIGGVIAIGQAASETFKIGITYFISMMGVISVNLFILNLLPIPVLDGGHLLFYTIEALRGAPLSMRKMEIAQQVGLVLLLSLMLLSLFNDFSRVLGFW